jgi:hypothetical protein
MNGRMGTTTMFPGRRIKKILQEHISCKQDKNIIKYTP